MKKKIAIILLGLMSKDALFVYLIVLSNWVVYRSLLNNALVPLGIVASFVALPLDVVFIFAVFYSVREYLREIAYE